MFYDITALFPALSMFHGNATIDISLLKEANGTVLVPLDATDLDAVLAYFTSKERAEAIRTEVAQQLQSYKALKLRYIYADENNDIVFKIAAPQRQWSENCCIYLEIIDSPTSVAISEVPDTKQALLDLSLNRVVKKAKNYDNVSRALQEYVKETFYVVEDNEIRPYGWKRKKTELRQIEQAVMWLDKAVRPLSITARFFTLTDTAIDDWKNSIHKRLQLRCRAPGVSNLSGQPNIFINHRGHIIGFVELLKLGHDDNITNRAINYLTALGRMREHPVFGVVTDLRSNWKFYWHSQDSTISTNVYGTKIVTAVLEVSTGVTAIHVLRALILYIGQTTDHDPEIEHFGEIDRPQDAESETSQSSKGVDEANDTSRTDRIRRKWFKVFDLRNLPNGVSSVFLDQEDDTKPSSEVEEDDIELQALEERYAEYKSLHGTGDLFECDLEELTGKLLWFQSEYGELNRKERLEKLFRTVEEDTLEDQRRQEESQRLQKYRLNLLRREDVVV